MLPKNRLFRILAIIAVVALAAIAVLWLGARTSWARGLVGDWIAEATGSPASVGSLRLGFLSGPAIEIGELAIAQPAAFGTDPLLEIGRARVSVPWSSLFGAPVVDTIAIEDAIVRPVLAQDGADNWSGLISHLAGLGGEGASAWLIGRFDLERGAVEFHDAATGSRWRLTAITIGATRVAPAVGFPLELRMAGVAGDNTFHAALNGQAKIDPDAGRYQANGLHFRGWAGGEPLPLAGVELLGTMELASYVRATGSASIERGSFNLGGIPGEFSGTLSAGETDRQMDFRVKTDTFAPRAPAITFGLPLPVTADPQAFQLLQLSFEGHLRDGRLHLDPIAGRLDDTQFDGRVIPAERLIRANLDRIDFNRYFAPQQKKARDKKATLEAAIEQLGQYDIDAEIRVVEARVAGARLRDIVVRVERNGAAQ